MSNIIPKAGRDRDKLIAKLKGIKPVYACYADNFAGDEYCVLNEDKPFDCRICEREKIIDKFKCKEWKQRPENEWLPQWSTDRNDAWELWEELPAPKRYYFHVNDKHEISYQNNMEIKWVYFLGDSFPDAVSKAWIERKQK